MMSLRRRKNISEPRDSIRKVKLQRTCFESHPRSVEWRKRDDLMLAASNQIIVLSCLKAFEGSKTYFLSFTASKTSALFL
jgi:hypothetical protein